MRQKTKGQRGARSGSASDASDAATPPNPAPKGRLFVAYAHEDHIWRDRLWNQLGFLRHHHHVDVFTDREIKPGAHWNEKILEALRSADIFVPLLSGAFAGSAYCNLVEAKEALDREARGDVLIVPVLVNHVDYEASPFGRNQMLPSVNGTVEPLADWPNPDAAIAEIARHLRMAIEERCKALSVGDTDDRQSVLIPSTPATSHRVGYGYQSADRNVFPECAELLLSATQGTNTERISLNAELRCGVERLRHRRRSFLLRVDRLRLRLSPDGWSFAPGPGTGDQSSGDNSSGRARVRRKAQRIWEITPVGPATHLDGYILGEENLADLNAEGETRGGIGAALSTYAENLHIEVLKDGKAGPQLRSLGNTRLQLLKIIFAKALRRDEDEIVLSECRLEPEQ